MKKITHESPLLADFYEITMLQTYFSEGKNEKAVFEFFVRQLPSQRNYLMAAGLAQVVDYLTSLHFDAADLAFLRVVGQFSAPFLDSLNDFQFTGDVDALPEGCIFFANEPVLRITAPLREAQFIESRVINLLHFQTMVASKAVRSVNLAPGKQLIDFGLRRSHGAEAGLLSARASYIAGFDGTSNMLAGQLFGIPVFGTMAHSFVQTYDYESDAFAAFARAFPDNATMLIDTYDSEVAAKLVTLVASWLKKNEGIGIKAVRIDSGDLESISRQVRKILSAGDCDAIRILASGNLDEYAILSLIQAEAPIDGFAIGTRMNTSEDAAFLDCAYKLVEYDQHPLRKRSKGKEAWPGSKQIFREYDALGFMCGDTVALHNETLKGEPLLQPVMRSGKIYLSQPTLAQVRLHAQKQLAIAPPPLRELNEAPPYIVTVSDRLKDLANHVDERQRAFAELDQGHWPNERA